MNVPKAYEVPVRGTSGYDRRYVELAAAVPAANPWRLDGRYRVIGRPPNRGRFTGVIARTDLKAISAA
jgi:hypothetical protein